MGRRNKYYQSWNYQHPSAIERGGKTVMKEILHIILDVVAVITIVFLLYENIRKQLKIKMLKEEKFTLEEEMDKVTRRLAFMEKTIPCELYKLVLGEKRGKIEDTSSHMPFAIVSMNNENFSDYIHTMEPNAVFEMINGLFTKTVPYVHEKNGEIASFQKAGFKAMFYNNCEGALEAAVSISEVFNREVKHTKLMDGFSMGVSYGSVLTGMAGSEERKSLVTVSEDEAISSYLQSIARKYNARILITGTFRKQIADVETKFHSRLLGYLYVTATQSLEELHDVYDGDALEIRNNKQKTKMAFEKGVKEFASEDYASARRYFIEVFKTNRYDVAAKRYLSLCEERISAPKDTVFTPQIETF